MMTQGEVDKLLTRAKGRSSFLLNSELWELFPLVVKSEVILGMIRYQMKSSPFIGEAMMVGIGLGLQLAEEIRLEKETMKGATSVAIQ